MSKARLRRPATISPVNGGALAKYYVGPPLLDKLSTGGNRCLDPITSHIRDMD